MLELWLQRGLLALMRRVGRRGFRWVWRVLLLVDHGLLEDLPRIDGSQRVRVHA